MRAPLAIPQGPTDAGVRTPVGCFAEGRRFRVWLSSTTLTRECLALIADTSLPGLRVMLELAIIIAAGVCVPTTAPSGNPVLHRSWKADFIESFNARLRDELLNQ